MDFVHYPSPFLFLCNAVLNKFVDVQPLDYDGGLPLYVNITDGKTADNKGAYSIPIQAGAVIVADRYYNDFSMLNISDSKKFFL